MFFAELGIAFFGNGQVFNFNIDEFALGHVVNDNFNGVDNGHCTVAMCVQILADAVFKHCGINYRVSFCNTGAGQKVLDGFRSVSAAAHCAKRRHTRVIPTGDIAALNKRTKEAFAHNSVGDVQPCKLNLAGLMLESASLDYPIVERAVRFVFKGTEGMGNALDSILNRVRKVIHGIDAPFVALVVMGAVQNPVKCGVAHIDVRRSHIDFRTEGAASVRKLAFFHAAEQVKVLLNAAAAVGTVNAGFGQRAAVFADFILVKITDICLAVFDEFYRKFVTFVEIIAAVAELIPIEAQPTDILFDCINKFDILLGRIGIVIAKIAFAAEAFGCCKIYPKSLCVADMKITVRLGREARFNNGAALHILKNELLDEIAGFKVFFCRFHFAIPFLLQPFLRAEKNVCSP